MSTELATNFVYVPQSFESAHKYATMVAKSSFCPKNYKEKPDDVFIAMQMGAELGLKPMQALQGIAVINGKPSVYGDLALALVRNHAEFEDIKEWIDNDIAYCEIKRKHQTPVRKQFSRADAQKAGLLTKDGPWKTYPERMLQMRARGFAMRDSFADALLGLILVEEAQDYPAEKDMGYATEISSKSSKAESLNNLLSQQAESISIQIAPEPIPTEAIVPKDKGVVVPSKQKSEFFSYEDDIEARIKESINVDDLKPLMTEINALTDFKEKKRLSAAWQTRMKELKEGISPPPAVKDDHADFIKEME